MSWREDLDRHHDELLERYHENGYEAPPGHPDIFANELELRDRLEERGPLPNWMRDQAIEQEYLARYSDDEPAPVRVSDDWDDEVAA